MKKILLLIAAIFNIANIDAGQPRNLFQVLNLSKHSINAFMCSKKHCPYSAKTPTKTYKGLHTHCHYWHHWLLRYCNTWKVYDYPDKIHHNSVTEISAGEIGEYWFGSIDDKSETDLVIQDLGSNCLYTITASSIKNNTIVYAPGEWYNGLNINNITSFEDIDNIGIKNIQPSECLTWRPYTGTNGHKIQGNHDWYRDIGKNGVQNPTTGASCDISGESCNKIIG